MIGLLRRALDTFRNFGVESGNNVSQAAFEVKNALG
jgi:hypothetical protein